MVLDPRSGQLLVIRLRSSDSSILIDRYALPAQSLTVDAGVQPSDEAVGAVSTCSKLDRMHLDLCVRVRHVKVPHPVRASGTVPPTYRESEWSSPQPGVEHEGVATNSPFALGVCASCGMEPFEGSGNVYTCTERSSVAAGAGFNHTTCEGLALCHFCLVTGSRQLSDIGQDDRVDLEVLPLYPPVGHVSAAPSPPSTASLTAAAAHSSDTAAALYDLCHGAVYVEDDRLVLVRPARAGFVPKFWRDFQVSVDAVLLSWLIDLTYCVWRAGG